MVILNENFIVMKTVKPIPLLRLVIINSLTVAVEM